MYYQIKELAKQYHFVLFFTRHTSTFSFYHYNSFKKTYYKHVTILKNVYICIFVKFEDSIEMVEINFKVSLKLKMN